MADCKSKATKHEQHRDKRESAKTCRDGVQAGHKHGPGCVDGRPSSCCSPESSLCPVASPGHTQSILRYRWEDCSSLKAAELKKGRDRLLAFCQENEKWRVCLDLFVKQTCEVLWKGRCTRDSAKWIIRQCFQNLLDETTSALPLFRRKLRRHTGQTFAESIRNAVHYLKASKKEEDSGISQGLLLVMDAGADAKSFVEGKVLLKSGQCLTQSGNVLIQDCLNIADGKGSYKEERRSFSRGILTIGNKQWTVVDPEKAKLMRQINALLCICQYALSESNVCTSLCFLDSYLPRISTRGKSLLQL